VDLLAADNHYNRIESVVAVDAVVLAIVVVVAAAEAVRGIHLQSEFCLALEVLQAMPVVVLT
jgi:hypothetical protein